MRVPSTAPLGHTTPVSDTPDSGVITPSGDACATSVPLATSAAPSTPEPKAKAKKKAKKKRKRGRPLRPRGKKFAPGGNEDAAQWAYNAAFVYKFTEGEERSFRVAASHTDFDKDEHGKKIGPGTWANCYAAIDTIAREACVSPRTVDRMVAKAKGYGLLSADGWGPHKDGEYAAVRYRLSGTPEYPLPVEVLRARAAAAGELFDLDGNSVLDDAADAVNAVVDGIVDNPSDLVFYHDFGVPAEQDFGVLPESFTGTSPVTLRSQVPVGYEDEPELARPAEGVGSSGEARAKSERRRAPKGPVTTPPKGRPTNPKGPRKPAESHVEPRTLVEWAVLELTERMTAWQRADTLRMARAVLAGEGITEEQLVHRLRANLRMVGGGNRAHSPYGFARNGLFKKPFGCDHPYCEDGQEFTEHPGQPPTPCVRCAERRMDRAAKRRQTEREHAAAAWYNTGYDPPIPQARGPRHPSDLWRPWCGSCDEDTRIIEIGFWERDPAPCPHCAPLPAGTVQGPPGT